MLRISNISGRNIPVNGIIIPANSFKDMDILYNKNIRNMEKNNLITVVDKTTLEVNILMPEIVEDTTPTIENKRRKSK